MAPNFKTLFAERGLSFDRLQSFLEVAEAGGMANAAPRDPVRQTQYSRQIKELEQFFGTALICRRGKGIALTNEGRELARLIVWPIRVLGELQSEGLQFLNISAGGDV